MPALLDRVRPVDVWFQVNVHRVSVWAVKPPTPEKPPTFWDKHGGNILLMFALGALIWGYLHWVSDGEITQWVFATFRNIWEYEKSHPPISF